VRVNQPGAGRHGAQFGQHRLGPFGPDLTVGLDIGGGERMGVGVVIIGPDAIALALQRVAHARGAGEQVADRPALRLSRAHRADHLAQKRAL